MSLLDNTVSIKKDQLVHSVREVTIIYFGNVRNVTLCGKEGCLLIFFGGLFLESVSISEGMFDGRMIDER
jgi:hypothetical protein